MKAEELRIGNYVDYEKTTHVVKILEEYTCVTRWIKDIEFSDPYEHFYEEIQPIPLTEEWLLKLGF